MKNIYFTKSFKCFLDMSGLKQSEFADIIKISQPYMSELYREIKVLTNKEKQEKIVEFFGYTIEEFEDIGEKLYNGEKIWDILRNMDADNNRYLQMCIRIRAMCPNPSLFDTLYSAAVEAKDRNVVAFLLHQIADSIKENPCPHCYPETPEGLYNPPNNTTDYGETKKNGTK